MISSQHPDIARESIWLLVLGIQEGGTDFFGLTLSSATVMNSRAA